MIILITKYQWSHTLERSFIQAAELSSVDTRDDRKNVSDGNSINALIINSLSSFPLDRPFLSSQKAKQNNVEGVLAPMMWQPAIIIHILTYARISRISTPPCLAGWTGGWGPSISDFNIGGGRGGRGPAANAGNEHVSAGWDDVRVRVRVVDNNYSYCFLPFNSSGAAISAQMMWSTSATHRAQCWWWLVVEVVNWYGDSDNGWDVRFEIWWIGYRMVGAGAASLHANALRLVAR